MFQEPPPQGQQYAPPPRPETPKWLTGVAIAVIVVMTGGAIYWFFGRPQPTSAGAGSPVATSAPATPASDNPVQKFVEVSGIRFSKDTKGIDISFVVTNHSDQDLVELAGVANIFAKTSAGEEIPIGNVKFKTAMAAQTSKDLTLPFETKKKIVDMPDWQNVSVKVQITSPAGA